MMTFEDIILTGLWDTDNTRHISRLNIDEAALLYHYVAELPDESHVVEIGSMHNGTTAMIAMALKTNSKLTAIDLFHQRNERAISLIEAYGCKHVELVDGDSTNIKPNDIDLLFIDGDHSYDGCRADIITHWDSLKNGRCCILHDCMPCDTPGHCEGVLRALKCEIEGAGIGIRIGAQRSLAVVKKVRDIAHTGNFCRSESSS